MSFWGRFERINFNTPEQLEEYAENWLNGVKLPDMYKYWVDQGYDCEEYKSYLAVKIEAWRSYLSGGYWYDVLGGVMTYRAFVDTKTSIESQKGFYGGR